MTEQYIGAKKMMLGSIWKSSAARMFALHQSDPKPDSPQQVVEEA
jgi:hypothetical protein